jgi:hypothetical protein
MQVADEGRFFLVGLVVLVMTRIDRALVPAVKAAVGLGRGSAALCQRAAYRACSPDTPSVVSNAVDCFSLFTVLTVQMPPRESATMLSAGSAERALGETRFSRRQDVQSALTTQLRVTTIHHRRPVIRDNHPDFSLHR